MFGHLHAWTPLLAGGQIPDTAQLLCRKLVRSFGFALASLALVMAGDQADAEMFDAWVDSDEITYESDRYWNRANGLSGLSHSRTAPRVAMRNEEYVLSSANPVLIQPQPQSPIVDSELPNLPPPSNPPPPATQAADPTDHDGGEVQFEPLPFGEELKKQVAEQKKPEKPVIPDLAKGILIASNDGDLTFKPGLRMTPRYNYETTNGNNDLFIRRFRLKGSGSAYGVAKYGAEIKIDNTGRFEVNPTAVVENAWLDFPVVEDDMYLRAGRFDIPMSRNELTSDSKLLLMDRTLIKEALTAVGMADKQYGVMLHGRPDCGRWEYDVGVFDSNVYEKTSPVDTRETDQLMPAARVTYSFLDRPTALDGYADYWASYIGKGQRLDVAFNTAYLGGITDGLRQFDQTGLGTDVFFNTGPYTFQTEYDWIFQDQDNGAPDALIHGWYAQFGYLIDYWCEKPCTEFAVRYQTLDSDLLPENLRWTSVGFNFYIREHNLKVQTDYTFRQGDSGTLFTMMQESVFQVQLQLDF